MQLIYILTYDCNFRCKYCDVYKHKNSISKEIINQSLLFLENNNFEISKVKFFGWEPLLKKIFIKNIINNFPSKHNPEFYVTTNSTLINNGFIDFCKQKKINLTFSIDWNLQTNNENRLLQNWNNASSLIIENTKKYSDFIIVNQVITSENSKGFFENFKFIYDLWVRNFNFLPAYYVEWTKIWLQNLKRWFDEILYFSNSWKDFKLVNLENYSDLSFFNLGLVIDTDWSIYGTNLILSWKFENYKKELKIWDVFNWLNIDFENKIFLKNYINKISLILEKEYTKEVLKSVKYVDLVLNNFCNEFKTYRDKYLKGL